MIQDTVEIATDSMGFGRHIGGPGVECTVRPLAGPMDIINRVRAIDDVSSTETFVYLDLKKQIHNHVAPQGTRAG